MQERVTARVVLLDPQNRILLMKARPPADREAAAIWFTVGGGVDPGETVFDAARREVREETGIAEVELGPIVWYRQGVFLVAADQPRLFKEYYVVARCAGAEPRRDGWMPIEQELVEDIRWWPADALAQAEDLVYPPGLPERLAAVLAGERPWPPLTLPWNYPPA